MLKSLLTSLCMTAAASVVQANVLICKLQDNGQGFVPSVVFLDIDEAKGMVRYADEYSIMIHKKSFNLPAKISSKAVRIKWKLTVPGRSFGDIPIAYSGMYHKGRNDFRLVGMSGLIDNRMQAQGACEPYKGKWPK